MTEPTRERNRITCSQAALLLETRVADDTLSHDEQHALDHHVENCEKCRKVVKWVSALPEYADELSDAEITAAYQTAVRRRNRLQRMSYRRKLGAAVVAAAAVFAMVLFNTGWIQRLLSENQDREDALLECSPAAPVELVSGVFMTYCAAEEPAVLIENSGEVRVSLRNGTVGMQIDPQRPGKRKVTVQTPQGQVRVKGTVFTVEVQTDNTHVEVFRGIVEFVSATDGEAPLYVTAGQGADMSRNKPRNRRFALKKPRAGALLAVLDTEIPGNAPPNQATSLANAPTATPAIVYSNQTEKSPDSNPQEETEAQWSPADSAAPVATNRGSRDDPQKVVMPVDALIQNAQSCLIVQDWNCAADHYRDILTHYPSRPEATAVLISLAKIELRHLNMPKMALSHYKAYQKRAPNGPMAEEALYGTAETYRKLGKEKREEETLRAFVVRYPRSTQIQRARVRLQRLQSNRVQ